MANCSVTGTLLDSSSTAVAAVVVKFRTVTPALDLLGNLVLPVEIGTTSDSLGAWSLSLTQGISGVLSFDYPPSTLSPTRRNTYSITVPATTSAAFASVISTEV